MEDVLEVYQRSYDENEVLVCMDETSKQQVKETRIPLAPQVGNLEKFDYEYERNGVSNLFMLFAPLDGWRHVKVTNRRTKIDWAHLIKELVDEHFPDKQIILVMDNLNTHKLASLYDAFEPAEARRIAEQSFRGDVVYNQFLLGLESTLNLQLEKGPSAYKIFLLYFRMLVWSLDYYLYQFGRPVKKLLKSILRR